MRHPADITDDSDDFEVDDRRSAGKSAPAVSTAGSSFKLPNHKAPPSAKLPAPAVTFATGGSGNQPAAKVHIARTSFVFSHISLNLVKND